MFPKLSNHFCVALLVTSSRAAFLQNTVREMAGRRKVFPKLLSFCFLQAHIATMAPSQIMKPEGPPIDACMSLLCTASSRASFTARRLVQHTGRRHLGLMPHPAASVYFPFPSKVDLGFVTSHSKWLDTVVFFFSF